MNGLKSDLSLIYGLALDLLSAARLQSDLKMHYKIASHVVKMLRDYCEVENWANIEYDLRESYERNKKRIESESSELAKINRNLEILKKSHAWRPYPREEPPREKDLMLCLGHGAKNFVFIGYIKDNGDLVDHNGDCVGYDMDDLSAWAYYQEPPE